MSAASRLPFQWYDIIENMIWGCCCNRISKLDLWSVREEWRWRPTLRPLPTLASPSCTVWCATGNKDQFHNREQLSNYRLWRVQTRRRERSIQQESNRVPRQEAEGEERWAGQFDNSHHHGGSPAHQVCHHPQDAGWEAAGQWIAWLQLDDSLIRWSLAGGHKEGIPTCNLRPDLAVARPPQERVEECKVLSVCIWSEGGQCLRQPLPLREGGQPRHRPVRSVHTGTVGS